LIQLFKLNRCPLYSGLKGALICEIKCEMQNLGQILLSGKKDFLLYLIVTTQVGTYKCGICECPPEFFGRNCECSADNLQLAGDLEAGCR
jgi:hypothetical protein